MTALNPLLHVTSLGDTDSSDCSVQEVARTPHVHIFAESPVTATEARTLERRLTAAARFGDSVQKWDDDAKWSQPVNATLLSDRCLSQLSGAPAEAVPGVTTGPDDIFLRRKTLRGNSTLDAEVLAHELVHIEDWRMAGRNEPALPLYLKEGKAYVVGLRYAAQPERLAEVKQSLSRLSGQDAAWVMNEFRTSHPASHPELSYVGEIGGALFVEWLDAHVKKNALAHLGNAFEGRDFARGFKKEFGITLEEAEQRFVDFVADTEGKPEKRFKGTLFA